MFPWESQWKILRVIKCHSGQSRAHLTVPTERVLFQANESCLCKSIWPFTTGIYGSPYDYVIPVALVATSRVTNITSFQPPLRTDVGRTFGSVRVMKGLKVTEIPLPSSWIHSLIMDIFTTCESCVGHVLVMCRSCDGHVLVMCWSCDATCILY